MIATSLMYHPLSPGHAQLREVSLEAAIVLRDGSFDLSAQTSDRLDCRKLMRVQAFKWRHSAIIFR